jgi:uncharacterized protein YyaL (SSP411 family)
MTPLALLLVAGAVPWRPWSAEAFDEARRSERLLFVWVGSAGEGSPEAEEGVAEALRSRFVTVRVDRDERPDIADVARLSLASLSDVLDVPQGASVWLVLTPQGRPFAGAASTGVLSNPGDLVRLADQYRERRDEVEARAGVAAARIVSAQASEPPQGALGRSVVERALKGVRGIGRPSPGAARLLLAERDRSRTPATKGALAEALDAYARAVDTPLSLPEEALRLRALSRGYVATGSAEYREAAEKAATRLARATRDGAFTGGVSDSRVFAGWNGLAIGALASSASDLGRDTDLRVARRAAEDVIRLLGPWPGLARCAGETGRCGAAFLEDYAFLAEGLLDLEEATGDARWRGEAVAAVEAAIARFLDASAGGFFDTDGAHGPLPARLRNGYDGLLPSANGVMASVLLRLAEATGEKRYRELARATVLSFLGDMERAPKGMETLAAAAVPMIGGEPAAASSGVVRPSRETRGAVTVEVSLSVSRARPDDAVEARVRLLVDEGWTINGPRPAAGLVPLSISAPGGHLVTGSARFPEGAAYAREAVVILPLRVRATAPTGPAPARLSVRFQACRRDRCEAPESVLLEAPLEIEAARH